MADIKIYGTLKNDTGEPIARGSQIECATTDGPRLLDDIIGDLSSVPEAPAVEPLTDTDIAEIIASATAG